MAYNSNIPQANNRIKDSQPNLLENFKSIESFVGVNHGTFNAVDEGKHKFVTFPVQASAPATAGGDWNMYSFLNALTARNELYVTNTSGQSSSFTASILSTNPNPSQNTAGWTMLPSGIMMKWGYFNGVTGLNTLNFAGPPFPNSGILVMVSPASNNTTGDMNFAVRFVDWQGPNTCRVYISSRTSTGPATGGYTFLALGY